MGDTIRIKVVAANLEKKQLDYEWVLGGGGDSITSDAGPNLETGVKQKKKPGGKAATKSRSAGRAAEKSGKAAEKSGKKDKQTGTTKPATKKRNAKQ